MTYEEALVVVERIERNEMSVEEGLAKCASGEWTDNDLHLVMWIGEDRIYRRWKKKQISAQRRALALFRSLLTRAERDELRRNRCVTIDTGSARYRLHPNTGGLQVLERHGSQWYVKGLFCYHEAEGQPRLPSADRSIAHLMLLRYDEERLLAEANITWRDRINAGWDGDWRRRLNAARREREATAA